MKLEYEFHFTQSRSYIVTPELETLDLLQKSGLYWLKWNRAIDPVAELQRSSNKAEIASMTRNVIAPSAAIAKRIVEKHIGSDCPLVLCELAACEACGEEIKAFCVKQK